MAKELVEIQKLEQSVSPVIKSAAQMVVSNAQEYSGAADFLKEIKTTQKKISSYWKPLKEKAHEAWKIIVAKEKEMTTPLVQAEQEIKYKMITFTQEEEEKRRKYERRLQAESDARYEKERLKLLKQAGKLKTPELKEQRLQEAQEVEAPVITVQSEVPKIKGQSFSKTWKARIVNKREAVEAALIYEALFAFLEFDLSRLNRFAANTKGHVKCPGIEFYEETNMSSGGVT